jgi:hypothetical protein
MALRSLWFKGNNRLQQCLISDLSHVKRGDQGEHVLLIQEALTMLDNARLDQAELRSCRYGSSTASAVKAYKTKRAIINYSYQTSPDDIVGRMTMQALDEEMLAQQQHLLLAVKISAPKAMVVSEPSGNWQTWGNQFVKADPTQRALVTVPTGASPSSAASIIASATAAAGSGGLVILSVGHGETIGLEDGVFDLAPGGTFRVGGRNHVLVGDPNPTPNAGKPAQTGVFYDYRTPDSTQQSGYRPSRLDDDEKSNSQNAKARLNNWQQYQKVCTAFRNGHLAGVLLLTCKIGGSVRLIQRVAQQWGTLVIGYKRRVTCEGNRLRARAYLDGDNPGSGTNIPWGEIMFPLSMEMIVQRP